jgi:bifunctional UDP-N-acetylglucosamine pyrophosphorylase/glucosamine-1-phosphate N-acetyltransferase
MEPTVNIIILAAGLGTRMKSKYAKVLHRAGGSTLIEHVVNTALRVTSAGRITVVVGHQAAEVKSALHSKGVCFAMQEEQKGTGHAVMICREGMPAADLIAVLYGDGPLLSAATLQALIDRQKGTDCAATLITTQLEDPTGYGRVILDEQGSVHDIVEEKAANAQQREIKLVNSGIYCFRADLLWRHIGEIGTDNPAREFYLTDIAGILDRAGHRVMAMEVADSKELLGINTRVELATVDRILRERKARELMLAGVTIEKPDTVTIDCKVRIGMDTIVEPFAQILGNTEIGADCRIGACSIIQDSRLADRVEVGAFTMIGTSHVAENAHVGPYARLRMGNHVEAGATIGNFVELKKTRFGAGAKANHLAYLGDSTIGDRVNIGAGTITCNFDGVAKHQTHIGSDAFIGSNSTLVAPIEIGEGSYVGAGSVITDPVPPKALALGRGRQVNKDGWVKKKKEPKPEAVSTSKK